jgi:hypothetical protein
MSVEEFTMKINKIAKIAEITEDQKRQQFIRGLNPMNQYNLRMMAKYDDTLDNIIKVLSEAEKYFDKKDSYFQPSQLNYGQPKHFTENEIDRIVEDKRVSARQKKPITEDDINRIVEERISARHKKSVTNSRDVFSALEIIAERLGYPDDSPRDVESINRFIVKEIEKLGHETFYSRILHKKPRKRTYSTKKTSKKTSKSKRRCSNCGRMGHTKTNCSSKKRSSKKVNLAQTYDSSNEESVTEGSETERIKFRFRHCYMNSRDVDNETETETESETESSSDSDDEPYRFKKKERKKKNGKETKEVTKKKHTEKKTNTKDNGVKNGNGAKNGNGVVISRKPKKDINIIKISFEPHH